MATDNTSIAFFNAINEATREQKSAMIEETEKYKTQQLLEAKATAEKKYDEYIAAATAKMSGDDGVDAQALSLNLKKRVLSVRQEIAESVFADVEAKINDFILSDGYAQMLKASTVKMVEICNNTPLTVYLNSRDMKYADEIKSIDKCVSVLTDDKIKLGGIYGICTSKSIKINDLLETRLDTLKDEFYENSGLTLNN